MRANSYIHFWNLHIQRGGGEQCSKLFIVKYALKRITKILKLSSKHIIGRYNIKPTEVVENNAAKLFILNYAFEELQKI